MSDSKSALSQTKKRSDSGWVQRAINAGRSVQDKELLFKKTVHFDGKHLGRIYQCHVRYDCDPAVLAHAGAESRFAFGVERSFFEWIGEPPVKLAALVTNDGT